MEFTIFNEDNRKTAMNKMAEEESAFIAFADYLESFECLSLQWTKVEMWHNAKIFLNELFKEKVPALCAKNIIELASNSISDYCEELKREKERRTGMYIMGDVYHYDSISRIQRGFFSAVYFMLNIEDTFSNNPIVAKCASKVDEQEDIKKDSILNVLHKSITNGELVRDYNYIANQCMEKPVPVPFIDSDIAQDTASDESIDANEDLNEQEAPEVSLIETGQGINKKTHPMTAKKAVEIIKKHNKLGVMQKQEWEAIIAELTGLSSATIHNHIR